MCVTVDLVGKNDMQLCGNGAVYVGSKLVGTTAFGQYRSVPGSVPLCWPIKISTSVTFGKERPAK